MSVFSSEREPQAAERYGFVGSVTASAAKTQRRRHETSALIYSAPSDGVPSSPLLD